MIRLAISTGRSLDELRDCSVTELELMEEEHVRSQTFRQLQALDASALGALSAQSPEGFAAYSAERRRLIAIMQPDTDPPATQ